MCISNYIHYEVLNGLIHFKLQHTAAKVWKWISNFNILFAGSAITYPCWDWNSPILAKGVIGDKRYLIAWVDASLFLETICRRSSNQWRMLKGVVLYRMIIQTWCILYYRDNSYTKLNIVHEYVIKPIQILIMSWLFYALILMAVSLKSR